jgi:hypothetical protein
MHTACYRVTTLRLRVPSRLTGTTGRNLSEIASIAGRGREPGAMLGKAMTM